MPTFYNVQETLVEVKPDGSIVPMLAEAWEISEDGLTYTFTIREAKFHDGSDLDSADVVYSMKKNAESPLSKLSAPHVNVTSVTAIDPTTVEIVLSQPSASFLKELGNSAGYVVPENFLEEHDANSEMIGTGPFVFGEYKPDTSLTLNRFEDYWGEKPYFETIDWRFVDDETAALNGLLAGEYNFITAVLAEGIERVATFSEDPTTRSSSRAPARSRTCGSTSTSRRSRTSACARPSPTRSTVRKRSRCTTGTPTRPA